MLLGTLRRVKLLTLMPNRTSLLAARLRDAGVDAFLAWSPVTMGFLHEFPEGAGERFLTLAIKDSGEVVMICPALSASQARRVGIQDVRPWRDGENPLDLFGALASAWNLKSAIVAVDDEMPAQLLLSLQAALPAALFKAGGQYVADLKRNKTADELEKMRQAAKIADEALAAGLAVIRSGATEVQVAEALNKAMAEAGGRPTFAIVAVGANGAEPHHLTDETVIKSGDVIIIDFGCEVDGYQSDITRTVVCGSEDEEVARVYEVVYRSHMAAFRAARPGVTAGEVDAAARKVIEDAGYGEFFMHRTGHGIGTQVHEEPYIIGGSDVVLEPGHCFSIEPGIYLEGRFGVRLENIVSMTETGCESLNWPIAPTIRRV